MEIFDLTLVRSKMNEQKALIGSEICYYDDVSSTMTIAKELAGNGASDGTVVLARAQTGGRGRLGRAWTSPQGGIWMSIILRPNVSPEETSLITLAAGVAVCRAITGFYLIDPGLKWPNDVVVRGKKVCGILTEGCIDSGSIKFAVIGIGINLNFSSELLPDELKQHASTLYSESAQYIDSTEFLIRLLTELNVVYKEFGNNKSGIINSWKRFSVTIGKEVVALGGDGQIQGIAKDISSCGGLIIEAEDSQLVEVQSGEVSLRGKETYI